MTHRDGLPHASRPGFSARSVRRGDTGHRKPRATLSERPRPKDSGKPSLWVIITAPWYKRHAGPSNLAVGHEYRAFHQAALGAIDGSRAHRPAAIIFARYIGIDWQHA